MKNKIDIVKKTIDEANIYSQQKEVNKIPALYDQINRDIIKTGTQIKNTEENIKKEVEKLNNLKEKNKIIQDTYEKVFNNGLSKISLIHKKQNNKYYIKARCYWDRRQREVQVGTIDKTIRYLTQIKKNFKLHVSTVNSSEMTWDMIQSDKYIIREIKKYACAKLKAYIIKKFINNNKTINTGDIDNSIRKNVKSETEQHNPDKEQSSNWYNSWKTRTS